MTSEDAANIHPQVLIERLSQAADRAQSDDLAGLAKMHTWCESLAAATAPDGSTPSSDLAASARRIAGLLEQIIVDESEDAGAVLSQTIQEIKRLSESGRPQQSPSPTLESRPPQSAPSDDEVAQKLARIFEDDPPPSDGTAQPPQTEAPSTTGAETATAEASYEQEPLTIDDKELEFVQGFVEEAGEHIEAVEAALLEVERAPEDSDHIDNLFRPFHTIKGMAGFLNLRDVNCLTHEVETLMDQTRKGKRHITPGLIDLIFDVVDILKAQIAAIGVYAAAPNDQPIPQPPVVDMIEKLREVVAGRIELEGRQPAAGTPDQKLGENLVAQGACAKEVVDFALQQQQKEPTKKTGQILTQSGATTARQVDQALRAQKAPQAAAPAATASATATDLSVRIETAKLDGLVEMVGELVIAQTLVGANPKIAADQKLIKDVCQVDKIVRDVQEVAMAMRMIPVGPTFQRMARLVRDVSRKAGKRVELHISGEETELDKNVIQQIGDPLVHMVRNAVDHGVETPDARRAQGKDETGHVYLAACHQGGNVVIEIRDDGKGLDPKKLIAKGIEKGIVQPGEELTDQQAYHLIFAPGFSMAEKVTDISGRGVGMDVVRRNIEKLRGKVEIASELGKGSIFSIRLPLTLAIIDGMVIRVGNERFIIPTISIEQALRPRPEHITTVQNRGEILNVRGRLVPLIQLGALFRLSGRIDPCETIVVIAHCEGRQIGLVVHELIGQQQVVIKSLGERFQRLQGVSGAAILGDGRVGLILEPSGLAKAHGASLAPPPESHDAADEMSTSMDHAGPEPSSTAKESKSRDEPVMLTA